MKTKNNMTCGSLILAVAVSSILLVPTLTAQPIVPPLPQPTNPVLVPAPVPVPVPVVPGSGVLVNIGVPDYYVWDGYEFVGLIGGQYCYLGPGNFWLLVSGNRLNRFRDWERDHHDWRAHAIRNERYRRDGEGKEHPWPAHVIDHHGRDGH